MKAFVEIRSQHSVGGASNRFGGPDTYIAVQVVPDGVQPLKQLRQSVALKRGIRIIHCGEGYRKNDGPRSAYGQALAIAETIAQRVNCGDLSILQ